jgi:hypothetical protein
MYMYAEFVIKKCCAGRDSAIHMQCVVHCSIVRGSVAVGMKPRGDNPSFAERRHFRLLTSQLLLAAFVIVSPINSPHGHSGRMRMEVSTAIIVHLRRTFTSSLQYIQYRIDG